MSKILFAAVATLMGAFGLGVFGQGVSAPIRGTVLDGLGRRIAGAVVQVSNPQGTQVATGATDMRGEFQIAVDPGIYSVRVSKASFGSYVFRAVAIAGSAAPVRVTLGLAPLQQNLVVTATGVETPPIQLGQSVETADRTQVAGRAGLTADDVLRELPGVQVVRTGAVGGLTSVMLRGGDAAFSKVLLDGVPVQRFDFGAYDFSTLTPEGLDSITVVNGADSVVYGSDAASGVIDIRTRTGQDTPGPELTLRTAGGSFGTEDSSAQLLGNWRPLDYAFTFGALDTRNQVPHNQAWNRSWSGNVGLRLPARAHLRAVLNRIASRAGDPNAFAFYGIADDSWQRQRETYFSLSGEQQTTPNWTNSFSLSQSAVNYSFLTAAPSGTEYDPCTPQGYPACPNYLGRPVTIVGANGYRAQGQAILDYGTQFPQRFSSDTVGRYATLQTAYTLAPGWTAIAGYRYSDERGVTAPRESWHDNGVFAELAGAGWNRVFGSAGVSEDLHSRFGNTVNPQASLAVLPRLGRGGWWDELRLRASAGTAQKDPNLVEDQNSLYGELTAGGAPPAGLGVGPIRPQRARTFEAGVDQYLAGDQARFSATWFDDRYYDLVQFVPVSAFPQLGAPAAVTAAAQAYGGAFLNAWSDSSNGVELEMLARHGGWHGSLSYTYLIPVVLKSYSSDAVSPSFNPAFPNIPIGAYSPLVGARPFNVAPESGTATLSYHRARWQLQGNAYVSSRRDGSTFLTDGNFGTSLLLPNHDLAPAYSLLSLSGFFQVNARITLEAVVSNLLNQDYQEVFGYPGLGRAARVGISFHFTRPWG